MSEYGKYTSANLHTMRSELLHELLLRTHEALIGLLWQIDDLKKFDELWWESHFDGTVPHEFAQAIHRLLVTQHPRDVCDKLDDELLLEFGAWWDRCNVGDSFVATGIEVEE